MSEVTTQAKPERRKRQKLEDMEGYKPSIYGLTRDELIDWAMEHGEKKFRATQIWDWLYKKRVQSFEEMTNISKDFIAKLNENFCVNPLKQRIVQESKDGTVKYLFELPDGMLIETVLMRQHYGLSVCVTTQVGCNIGCTFCASGLIKKQRDLTAGEIVAQIMLVQKYFDDRDIYYVENEWKKIADKDKLNAPDLANKSELLISQNFSYTAPCDGYFFSYKIGTDIGTYLAIYDSPDNKDTTMKTTVFYDYGNNFPYIGLSLIHI